ncbi:uracil-DNA glycosylase [Vannielia litorea]|nr:uracil-DNA glycosylase [Vannielia litorea]
MLDQPHIAPLAEYCRSLRSTNRGTVPDFDPCDGGVAAQMLFLMEKPGPMAGGDGIAGRTGSGFVSRDNNDPTAEAILRFMEQAAIGREQSVLWNTVPWWNGTRKVGADELSSGIERLDELLDLLPKVSVVVGVGAKAGKARELVERRTLPFIQSAHPSPINRARRRAVWEKIPDQWRAARTYLADGWETP